MGDGDKTPLRLQFYCFLHPKVRLEFHGATITSDAGLLPPFESWMMPWALPILLPTIWSRKAAPVATSDTTSSRCSESPSTAALLATMTRMMPNAFPKTQP